LAEATDVEMRQAIMDNMARNLSRQPEKMLGVEFLDRGLDVSHGGVNTEQAAWFRPAPSAPKPEQRPDPSTVEALKTAIEHSPIKLLRGPEEARRERRSTRRAAERPNRQRQQGRDRVDVAAEFADALRREGFLLRGAPVMDGKWHRERVEGDKGHTKSGRYKAYDDGLPAGFIQNFKRGEGIRWRSERPAPPMTDADRQQFDDARAARQREQSVALQGATEKAQARWKTGRRVERHLYLETKGINPDEAFRRDSRGNLIIAMTDGTGLVRNVQTIAPDGQKRFVPGAQVTGLFSLFGKIERNKPILIAEGVATARSVFEATGITTVVAYNAGNLSTVSKVIANIAPSSRQIFAADNDHHLPRKDVPQPNVGKEKAEAAAREVGGLVLLPHFGAIESMAVVEGKSPPTDWNDYAKLFGTEKLKAAIEASLQAEGIPMPQKQQETAERAMTQDERDAARQTRRPDTQDQAAATRQQELQRQAEIDRSRGPSLGR
jgi:phage/plasmid primase-like uncharacterized protein